MGETKYIVRLAEKADKDLLFTWANDPTVRNSAFSKDIITIKEHNNWFKKALEDPNVVIYIMLLNGTPIGQCRFNISQDGLAEIDYSIDRDYRGKGVGEILIRKTIEAIQTERSDIRQFIGRVKPDNVASIRTFEKNNFKEEYRVFRYSIGDNT